jgi:hypothetical protein
VATSSVSRMSQSVVPFRPPLLRAVDEIALLLDEVAELQPTYPTTGQKQELLVAVEQQSSRLAALKARTLAAAGDVAEAHGTRDAGAWLAHETRQDPAEGRSAQRLAEGLDQRWPIVATAYAAGSVSTAQAQVIGRALDDLPSDLDPELRTRAEEHLVAEAAHFCPRDLRVLADACSRYSHRRWPRHTRRSCWRRMNKTPGTTPRSATAHSATGAPEPW